LPAGVRASCRYGHALQFIKGNKMNRHLAMTLVACAFAAAAGNLHAQVSVSQPWVRSTVAGQKVAGVFMKLESKTPAALVGGSSAAARALELHETRKEGEVMRMVPVQNIPFGPGKPAELKPGGLHVMLIDLARPLNAGETVPLELVFEQGGVKQTVKVQAEVRNVMHQGGGHGHHK